MLMAAMALCACDRSGGNSPQEPTQVASVCELATGGAALDGRLVRFRSRFDVGVEFVRAFDSECPRIMVFLRASSSNVDLTLCSEPGMRYGCPVDPYREVKATFTGVFRGSKGGGVVQVTSMTEVASDQRSPD